MILFARCGCGYIWESTFFTNEARRGAILVGNVEVCPKCGSDAPVDDALGTFVSAAVRQIRSADVYDLDAFRTIVRRASKGEITPEEAANESERLGAGFAALLRNIKPAYIDTLLSVIAIALTVAIWLADNADDAAALAKLEENRQATIALQYKIDAQSEINKESLLVNKMILEELRAARLEEFQNSPMKTSKPNVLDFAAARAARNTRK